MTAASIVKSPQIRIHKPTGQAYIFVNGRLMYLGRHGKPQTLQKYHQLVAELVATGGQPPAEKTSITVKELIARFWVLAQRYYVNPDTLSEASHSLAELERAASVAVKAPWSPAYAK